VSTTWGENDNIQQLELTGSPTMIFDRRYYMSSLSNEGGVCDVRPKTTFDKHNGIITILYNIAEFLASPVCRNVTNPAHMGYVPAFDGPDFRLSIDVRSLITGAAINQGILDPYELAEIPFTSTTVTVDGKNYDVDEFYNPRFPGMKPLYCQRDKDEERTSHNATYSCVIRLGVLYFYPTFNHIGSNRSAPAYCDCQSSDPGVAAACNSFNFIPSLVFYEFEDQYFHEQSEDSLVHFTFLDGYSGAQNNRNVFEAAFDAVVDSGQRRNATWRREAYRFCAQHASNHTAVGCSLLTVLAADFGHSVSDYYYQVSATATTPTPTATPITHITTPITTPTTTITTVTITTPTN
jgi:hypothetical protein